MRTAALLTASTLALVACSAEPSSTASTSPSTATTVAPVSTTKSRSTSVTDKTLERSGFSLPSTPAGDAVHRVLVDTVTSPSWVAWSEVEINRP